MEIKREFKKFNEKHIHSPSHALADELSVRLSDRRNFALYLGMAIKYNHDYLRRIAGEVLENKSVKKPGALFAYLVKKNNAENSNNPKPDTK